MILNERQLPASHPGLADHVTILRGSPVPLYHQVAEQIESAIQSGMLEPGQKIDNEISLARDLELSRPTVRQAIDVLVRKGLLIRRRGIGTQVTRNSVNRRVELTSFYDDLKKSGALPSTRVMDLRAVPADARLAKLFEIHVGDELVYVKRLRLAKSEPLALMTNWLPARFGQITVEQLTNGSLYGLLRALGHSPKLANQRFSATLATAACADLLGTSVGAPLLSMTRTSYDADGLPIEYAEHLYLGEAYSVEVNVAQ